MATQPLRDVTMTAPFAGVASLKIATVAARTHGLDAARALLMLLGIVLHSAAIYAPHADWIVRDPANHRFFGWLVEAIHVFRMPAFFWIAGYFCAHSFLRLGNGGMLKHRLPRLILPLLATLLLVNTMQNALVPPTGGQTSLLTLYHLWFLVDLTLFMVLAALLLPWASRVPWLMVERGPPPLLLALGGLALAAYLPNLAVRAADIGYEIHFGLTSLHRLSGTLPFFAIGALMYMRRDWRAHFLSMPLWPLAIALPLALLLRPMTAGTAAIPTELAQLAYLLMTWVCIASLIGFIVRHCSAESRLTRQINDAAYSIYLFHHAIIAILGSLMIALPWSPWIKMPLIMLLTAIIAFGLHQFVIRPTPILRLLFNGIAPEPEAKVHRPT